WSNHALGSVRMCALRKRAEPSGPTIDHTVAAKTMARMRRARRPSGPVRWLAVTTGRREAATGCNMTQKLSHGEVSTQLCSFGDIDGLQQAARGSLRTRRVADRKHGCRARRTGPEPRSRGGSVELAPPAWRDAARAEPGAAVYATQRHRSR